MQAKRLSSISFRSQPSSRRIFPKRPACLIMLIPADREGMRRAAALLHARGAKAVLVKGGHAEGRTSDDILFDGASYRLFSVPRVVTRNTRGTGCTLSSAIAAFCAQGFELGDAIGAAKTYLAGALTSADDLSAGHGPGPVNHFYDTWKR